MDGLDGEKINGSVVPILDELGEYGAMKSIPPFHTGPCWASIYTGLEPPYHGLKSGGWLRKTPYNNQIYATTIWELLRNIGVFNMPITWPPRKVNGWMVSGFPAIEDSKKYDMTYPKEIERYLPSKYLSDTTSIGLLGTVEHLKKAIEIVPTRLPLMLSIFEDYPVNVLVMGYTFPDRFGHYNAYGEVPFYLQRTLEEIVDEIEYDRLIIVSDHGFEGKHHSEHAFYLTNFGGKPKRLTDIYQLIRSSC